MAISIIKHNDKGQRHGTWERYWNDGTLWYKGYYLNDVEFGHWAHYYGKGKLVKEVYYAR